MNRNELLDVFDKFEGEQLRFNRVLEPLSNRRDLHAMLLVSQLQPDAFATIIAGADHDVVFLNVDMDEFAATASPEDIADLVRCGVMYDPHRDSLKMFV